MAGGYAWAITVLHPAVQRGAAPLARAAAALAALALVLGCFMARRRIPLGRALGLHAFIGASVVTWALSAATIGVDRLDPITGAMGSLAWLLFALAWGVPREPERVPEDDPGVLAGDDLPPREPPSIRAAIATTVGVTGSALTLAAAFTITRKEHALFGHALAVGLSIAVLTASARIGTAAHPKAPAAPAFRRLSDAALPLALVVLVLVAGFVSRVGK